MLITASSAYHKARPSRAINEDVYYYYYYYALGVGVVDDGQSVERGPIRSSLAGTSPNLLAKRFDVGVLNPDGLVRKTLEVQGIPTSGRVRCGLVYAVCALSQYSPCLPSSRRPRLGFGYSSDVVENNWLRHGGKSQGSRIRSNRLDHFP